MAVCDSMHQPQGDGLHRQHALYLTRRAQGMDSDVYNGHVSSLLVDEELIVLLLGLGGTVCGHSPTHMLFFLCVIGCWVYLTMAGVFGGLF